MELFLIQIAFDLVFNVFEISRLCGLFLGEYYFFNLSFLLAC
jgi:hypothetical protein